MTTAEIERLLYTDDNGEEINILELRSLEPIYDRIDKLKCLLSDDNPSHRIDSAILLTSWGFKEGVDYLENFLDRDAIDKEGKYLCRNNKDDCTYDVIGESLVIFTRNNPEIASKVIAPLRKVLYFIEKRCFDSGTVSFLTYANISTCLIEDFKQIMISCIEAGKMREASQIFPLYVKWGGEEVMDSAVGFSKIIINNSDYSVPKVHVASALSYLPLKFALIILPLLENTNDSGVRFYIDKFLRDSYPA